MRIEKLIERVEGEATLLLRADSRGLVESARILFPRFRGIEKILERKEAMDALAITPRVCGICGHAHLIATVRALEACYEAAGAPLAVSPKAETIREITLMLEMAQNHFKWFYLTLLPAIPGFDFRRGAAVLAAHRAAAVCARAIALFAGQWPHNSYALPGGVACDPTHVEVMQALGAVEEAMAIFRDTMGGIGVEEVACLEEPEPLLASGGELGRLYRYFKRREWLK
ncbi:nickel-dependent hydrogenase large subunit, partial [Hydrogenimonas sp.]